MPKGSRIERRPFLPLFFPILALVLLGGACTYSPRCDSPPGSSLTDPVGLALSPDGKFLFVSNANSSLQYCSGYISRVDTGTIPYRPSIAYYPGEGADASFLGGMAFSPDGNCLFVADRGGNELLVLRVPTEGGSSEGSLSLVARIPVGEGPYALTYFSPAAQVLVTNLISDDVSVVDGIELREVARIPLTQGVNGSRPSGIVVSPTTGPQSHYYAFATQQLSPYISVLDLSLLCEFNPLTPATASAPVFNDIGAASHPTMSPIALQQCSVGSELWSVTFTAGAGEEGYYTVLGNASGLQPNTALEGVQYTSKIGGISFTILKGDQPTTPGDSFTFVTSRRKGYMTLLENSYEGYTRGIAVFPGMTRAAIASRGLRGLLLADLNSNSIVDVISVCDTPESVAIGPDENAVYVTCLSSNTLYQVNPLTRQIEGVIPTEKGPSTIVLSPDGSRAYVANYQAQSISVVDLQTLSIIGRIP